jgi:hypothetical protein
MGILCDVFLFATHDLDLQAEFPHEHSAWVDGGPVTKTFGKGDLARDVFAGIEQTRTVTQEGLQAPPHAFSHAVPPKFPPHRLIGYRCDQSLIGPLNNHVEIVAVYVIETVNADDYDSLPSVMQGMRRDDPIKDGDAPENIWTQIRNGLINETQAAEKPLVTNLLDNWHAANPEGTAEEFGLVVRNYTR